MPVLLIVTRPSAREAYWLCVQEHFQDGQKRISRTAYLDKQRDRFDKSCFPALIRLGRSAAASQELLLLRGPIEVLGLSELAQRSAVLTDPSKRAEALIELEGALRGHGYLIQAHEVMGRRAESLMTAGQPQAAAVYGSSSWPTSWNSGRGERRASGHPATGAGRLAPRLWAC